MYSRKVSILAAAVLASSLALTGCVSTDMGSTTTEVIDVKGPNLSGKTVVGEEAKELFNKVVTASGDQAEKTGWTEKMLEGNNVYYFYYDPTAPTGKKLVIEQGKLIEYGLSTETIYPYFIQPFLDEFSYTIKLSNGTFTITSTTDGYKSVIDTKDGLISKITTTGEGSAWDLVSVVEYKISEETKAKMSKAVVVTEQAPTQ